MTMIRINCFFQAGEGERDYKDALLAAILLAEKSIKHAGCVAYDVFQSASRSDVFMICETWQDRDSLDKHSTTPEFKQYCKIMNERGTLKIEQFELMADKRMHCHLHEG